MRSMNLGRAHPRIRVASVVLVLGLLLLAGRAAHLSVFDTKGEHRGERQTRSVFQVPAPRGLVTDRNGAELAITVAAPSVYAIPSHVGDVAASARALAPILDQSIAGLEQKLSRKGQFAYLARWVSAEQAAAVEALALPGVALLDEPRRRYPHGALAASVLGFANIDGVGARGIEQREDAWLRGKQQKIRVQRDARRRALAIESIDPYASAGGDVALTLDATLQAEAETILAEQVEATGARGGLVLSLDPRSGEILALAENPSFDPNRFRTTPYESTRSRAFLDAVEPGSTMKPFVIAAALESGVLTPEARIDCESSGHFRVPGKTIRDFRPYGVLDLAGIIRVSSNIGATKVGQLVGPENHYQLLRRFGFGTPTGVGFPEESAGLLRHYGHWQPVDHATISFGHGLNVTAIQLASAVAAFANDGVWVRPSLIRARRAPGRNWQLVEASPTRQTVRPEVARSVVSMMTTVVGPGGTGRRAGLRGVDVAGKTGTAQKLDPVTGGYSHESYLAWFVGIAPAEDPVVVTVVVIDEPKEIHGGGAVAAPVFARVAAGQLARHDILTAPEVAPLRPVVQVADTAESDAPNAAPTTTEQDIDDLPQVAAAPTGLAVQIQSLGDQLLVPDFHGWTVSDVLRATAGTSLRVETRGEGRATAQIPAPGTILGSSASLQIHFEGIDGPGGDEG